MPTRRMLPRRRWLFSEGPPPVLENLTCINRFKMWVCEPRYSLTVRVLKEDQLTQDAEFPLATPINPAPAAAILIRLAHPTGSPEGKRDHSKCNDEKRQRCEQLTVHPRVFRVAVVCCPSEDAHYQFVHSPVSLHAVRFAMERWEQLGRHSPVRL